MCRNRLSSNLQLVGSVFCSLAALFVSIQANQISEVQTLIALNSSLPVFEINQCIEEDTKVESLENSVIEISKVGGLINNYSASSITLYCTVVIFKMKQVVALQ